MNHVRSPENTLRFFFRFSSVAYFWITSAGGVSGDPSSSPRSILSKMSFALVLMSMVILSTFAWRYSGLSVAGSYDGLRTKFRLFVGSKPEIGLSVLQLVASSLSLPSSMYGPEAMMYRP